MPWRPQYLPFRFFTSLAHMGSLVSLGYNRSLAPRKGSWLSLVSGRITSTLSRSSCEVSNLFANVTVREIHVECRCHLHAGVFIVDGEARTAIPTDKPSMAAYASRGYTLSWCHAWKEWFIVRLIQCVMYDKKYATVFGYVAVYQ